MKTLKITTTLATLNLVLFMSVSSIANTFTGNIDDVDKKIGIKEIESSQNKFVDVTSSTGFDNEFNYLRFDANKYNTESVVGELPMKSLNYLRFDARNFSEEITTEITELPVMNQFEYLRFDLTNFSGTPDLSEMPVNEFTYLRFDIDKYSNETSPVVFELPVN